jgi:hypothetical protein
MPTRNIFPALFSCQQEANLVHVGGGGLVGCLLLSPKSSLAITTMAQAKQRQSRY